MPPTPLPKHSQPVPFIAPLAHNRRNRLASGALREALDANPQFSRQLPRGRFGKTGAAIRALPSGGAGA